MLDHIFFLNWEGAVTSVHDTRWPCSPHRVHELWLTHFSVFKVNNMQICPPHPFPQKWVEFFEASGGPVERSRLLDDRLCRRRQPSNSKGTPSNVSTRVRNLVCRKTYRLLVNALFGSETVHVSLGRFWRGHFHLQIFPVVRTGMASATYPPNTAHYFHFN